MTSTPTICLLNLRNADATHAYHNRNKQNYLKIIERHYRVRNVDLVLPPSGELDSPAVVAAIVDAGGPFVFNDLDYAVLLRTYVYGDARLRHSLLRFLRMARYLVYFCEVFRNDDLQTVGNDAHDRTFAATFFRGARRVLLSNTRNAEYLRSAGITGNSQYYPPYGLSYLNRICPLPQVRHQPIDVLIYGNMHRSFTYRNALTAAVVQFCIANRLLYCVTTGLYDDKDALLSQTKMVVHVPSHEGIETFPWAKAVELMAKKVFFLIEDNDELHQQHLESTVAFYRRNDQADLCAKMQRYLSDGALRADYRERCYRYLSSHYDMDADLPRILRDALGDKH